mgnify:CR=1 FL=1
MSRKQDNAEITAQTRHAVLNYYHFLKSGIKIIDGLPVLDEAHLIPFKVKAYIEIKERVLQGERGQSRHIRKHRNDVLKLLTLLYEDKKIG